MTNGLFEKQVAIVTGAGVGIGYAIAEQLALGGASVLLNDVDAHVAGEAAGQIQAAGGICEAFAGDVSNLDTVQAMVDAAVARYGRLDMLVCNAGLTVWGDFFAYTPDMFDRVVSLNLRGTYFLTQAAARQMRAQGDGGRILFMSSVTGHQAVPYLSVYSMSKAGLEMLAKNLVIELSPYHVTVNCIAPGATTTPRNLSDDPNYDAVWGRVTPTGKVSKPLDMAQAALFFLSPAASQVTGQTLVVDGGWSAISPSPSLDFVEKPE
ncbi:MAG: SDR family oxidoreductase [Chloroflexi bacterium]|nr:SDR family oxidoreductase [Chloroflexota bacterium]MCC6892164.1 SDR family oxidoreductase [Anaerolineae bacterium]